MISRCKICKNRFFNTFFPLSHTFYFETRPSPLSKIGENAFGAHVLQLYRKNEYGDPHFLFHDFNKDSASFRWEKNWHKSMFSFFYATLERKVKTRALKGIFLICRWINNTLKSNSVRYHMHHRKNLSFLCSFGLRAVFVKRVQNSRICQHCDVKTSTVTPTFYYFFYHLLDLLHQCTKFHLQSILRSFTKESP